MDPIMMTSTISCNRHLTASAAYTFHARELWAGARRVQRILWVAYAFPPVGGGGVQRVTKLLKYLPRYGWAASVLTASNPSLPLADISLGDDIPADTIVRRARTFEPSYKTKSHLAAPMPDGLLAESQYLLTRALRYAANVALQPDAQVLWAPLAIKTGFELLASTSHAGILATGPPFSSFLVGAALSRHSGLPLILDYRDEWDLSNRYWENKSHGRITVRFQRLLETFLLRSAAAVVATTDASARVLQNSITAAGSMVRAQCIANGFDPDDFLSRPATTVDDTYRLTYVGTLWNVTSVEPLVQAVTLLAERSPNLSRRLELTVVGRCTPQQQALLRRLNGLPCRLIQHPYQVHTAALPFLTQATALCLLLADLPGVDRIVPAKLFEYLASRKPIVAIAPRGEVWRILRRHPGATLLEPRDVVGIASRLASHIQDTDTTAQAPTAPDEFVDLFSIERRAIDMAALFRVTTMTVRGSRDA
jgi:glycosyltransferase involved in cell wall biosynthesis